MTRIWSARESQKGMVTSVKKKEQLMSQRKQANDLIIGDTILQQIRLRAVLTRLQVSPMRKVWHSLSDTGGRTLTTTG
jgi:hypothetical protein